PQRAQALEAVRDVEHFAALGRLRRLELLEALEILLEGLFDDPGPRLGRRSELLAGELAVVLVGRDLGDHRRPGLVAALLEQLLDAAGGLVRGPRRHREAAAQLGDLLGP